MANLKPGMTYNDLKKADVEDKANAESLKKSVEKAKEIVGQKKPEPSK